MLSWYGWVLQEILQLLLCHSRAFDKLTWQKGQVHWTEYCQKSFEKLQAILKSAPVLYAPSCDKEFKLAVDAGDVGAGSVL